MSLWLSAAGGGRWLKYAGRFTLELERAREAANNAGALSDEDDELAVGERGRGLLGRGSSRAGGSDRFEDVASLEPRPELFEPPFGVLCTLFAMQLCKSVTAFGLADTVEGRTSPGARQPYYSSVSGEGVAVFDLDEVGRGATGHRGRVAGIDRAILRLLAMTQNLTLA